MFEDVDSLVMVAAVFVAVLSAVLIWLAYSIRKSMSAGISGIESNISKVERMQVDLKGDLSKMSETLSQKVSVEDMNKRIGELIAVVSPKKAKKKKTARKKKAAA